MSLREDILAIRDVRTQKLTVPEWNKEVWLRTISGAERDRIDASVRDKSNPASLVNFRARFAVMVLSDEQGNRIFTDADAIEIGKKSQSALDRILTAGLQLNGMAENDVDDLEKKSETGPSADSGSV